ncbi:GGDEF domain-containing protein [uncultured Ilyobacter sp.]|uniref:GGDEF domain-containing protein n=1 Tax=uncultured Ilyobacter sp. TaxID=544433 RepID=UPI0029C098A0|nr:GGDEF domain-containing protein [uncultured Ilyobacter sp.]
MKNILKNKKYTEYFPLLSLIFGIFLCFYMVNQLEKKHLLEETDINLLRASKSIKYILGNEYITSTMDNSTYSKEYIIEKGALLNEMSKQLSVDYLYLLVKKDDDIHYAIMSDTSDFLQKHPTGYYWESLKNTEDDSFELTWKSFDSEKPVFLNSSDIWGSYRSAYVREISKDGTVYIAGADTEMSFLNRFLSKHTLILLLNTIVTLLFAIPLMFSFRKLTLESFSLKKESRFIKSKDPLTGAYNRKNGINIFKNLAETFKDEESQISICLIDIKNLGYINKKMGLKAGDDIVKIVVAILKQSFRNSDKVVRLEGDKFMVILPDCSNNARGLLIKKLKTRLSIFNKMNKKIILLN